MGLPNIQMSTASHLVYIILEFEVSGFSKQNLFNSTMVEVEITLIKISYKY